VSSIEFAARDAAAFTTDGRVVDLRARYTLLNLQLELRARRLLVGVFGETSVATTVCTGVHRYFSPPAPSPSATPARGGPVVELTVDRDRLASDSALRLRTSGGLDLTMQAALMALGRLP